MGPMMGGGPKMVMPQNEDERRAVEDLLRKMRAGKGEKKGGESDVSVPSNRARVVVRAPADARLWVDQVECPIPGTVRSFDTPDLNPERTYSYTIRVAFQRNGQRIDESRRIPLIPGQVAEVDFSNVGAVRTAAN